MSTPIEVEETWLGKTVDVLLNCITGGHNSITPYTYVSFRVLQRLADILMFKKWVDDFSDIIDPY